jgi:hypothetical protein
LAFLAHFHQIQLKFNKLQNMKALSFWSHAHPWTARVLIGLLLSYIIVVSIAAGIILAEARIELPEQMFWGGIIAFLLCLLIYPSKRKDPRAFHVDYWRCRVLDIVMLVACLSMTISVTNHDEMYEMRNATTSRTIIPAVYHEKDAESHTPRKTFRKVRKYIRSAIREVSSGLPLWAAILLSLLLGTALLAAAMMVAYLSCVFSCAGSGVLAVLTLLGGGFLLTALGIVGFRAIWMKKNSNVT